MKGALWYGYKDIRVEEMPEPPVKPGYVKIKVAWAGICGTDRHEYTGPVFLPQKKPHRLTGRMTPLVMGHEFSGIVTEIGRGVTCCRVGDRVIPSGSLVCQQCRWCLSGKINICEKLGFNGVSDDGGFAQFAVVPEYQIIPIPNEVSLEHAILAEPLACGIHATKLIGNIIGKRIVVIGLGMIGLSAVFAAKQGGASKVLAVGKGMARERIARRMGADGYLDSSNTDVYKYVQDWSDREMADVVYECVGREETLNQAVEISRNGAKIMVMGVFEKKPRFPINHFQEGERILMGSQAYVDEMVDALDYISKGRVPAEQLITAKIPLDRIVGDGFEELINNGGFHNKIAVKIGDME